MSSAIQTVIFDMDGVLIDSEPLWAIAEKEVFSLLGVQVTPELCEQTKSMTTSQVTEFWYKKHPWQIKSLKEVEAEVIQYVKNLIVKEGQEIKGIKNTLQSIKNKGYRIALATNAPYEIIPVVLKKLNIVDYFDFYTSSEFEVEGKPHPAVYQTVAKNLKTNPKNCIVFEDSYSGLLAAKRANMKTIAYRPLNIEIKKDEKIEDFTISSFNDPSVIDNYLLYFK